MSCIYFKVTECVGAHHESPMAMTKFRLRRLRLLANPKRVRIDKLDVVLSELHEKTQNSKYLNIERPHFSVPFEGVLSTTTSHAQLYTWKRQSLLRPCYQQQFYFS